MYSIIETEAFSDWLNGLRDTVTRMRLIKRLQRASLGNLGDVRPVGEGVYEMREFSALAGASITCSRAMCC